MALTQKEIEQYRRLSNGNYERHVRQTIRESRSQNGFGPWTFIFAVVFVVLAAPFYIVIWTFKLIALIAAAMRR